MNLSPDTLDSYIGQTRIRENIKVILAAMNAKYLTEAPMHHVLLSGPSGLGKTTLAEIIAKERDRPLIKLMGPRIKDISSFDILKDIAHWTFIFIDEVHALPTKIEEALYEPMDNFTWD